ncbi:MAG TPA: peptidase [Nitrospirales bacterium]|nr:peptidase [Nitrospirales bacterium]HIA14755.1 peptidase [Nitrospirales bacterium]HIB54990.1 peptidase [Nitrospirales bacterium]HIC05112.1 peptidase [Nitrospirales bacterium]HIN32590.1 peptidase [Nitrospirales bacterium]
MTTPRLFGIETEYGIAREGMPEIDPVVESMELVRSYLTGPFEQSWDYTGEDPHVDQRGFRVSSLQQDREEDQFAELDSHRPFTFHEMKSDLVLTNGARFYNDHTHPEYSTPECRSLVDLVAHDRAGERIVFRAAQKRNQDLESCHVKLYKNNTDFHGHSYGCHDNYLVSRGIPFEHLSNGLMPFLVTRQIFSGAGKVGIEAQERDSAGGVFQISQRADFMETQCSVDTMHDRPILNTRDEPHADRKKYRRLHLILGDANMCEYATALKVGTTRVVLEMIERGICPSIDLDDPVAAIKTVSQNPTLTVDLPCKSRKAITAVDIQRRYVEAATKALFGTDAETDWILNEWSDVLDQLTRDRSILVGRVDWITKQWLLETFMEAENLEWTDPWLASLDLEYHNVDPEAGLFLSLETAGNSRRVCDDAQIEEAIRSGPSDTRGGIRGLCVSRFPDRIQSVQWERIFFKGGIINPKTLEMGDLFDPDQVWAVREALEQASNPASVCE